MTARSPPATNSVGADELALEADDEALGADEAALDADDEGFEPEHAPIATTARTTTNNRRFRRINTGAPSEAKAWVQPHGEKSRSDVRNLTTRSWVRVEDRDPRWLASMRSSGLT
ncbi:MAG TPA: hypothetical protein VFO73_05410 [Candidatus Limnocylindrales bacterium]|nr:hypothetical protein [Candidatus Limnocylindrales bacterium]